MSQARALDQLCALLRGRTPPVVDWDAVIALANEARVTPRLADVLDRAAAPEDVRTFVGEVSRRNTDRNLRLLRQAGEAAAILNAAGIEPLLIKGAAVLARTSGASPDLIVDVDLVVAPGEIDASVALLTAAGFELRNRYSGAALHAVAELARPEDVGAIDLHQRPPGPPGFVTQAELASHVAPALIGKARVRTPEPHLQLYLLALHDQLHDARYWRGGFDLRHAFQIADLAARGVDWDRLAGLPPTRLTRRALDLQLAAAQALAGAEIPDGHRSGAARLGVLRQRLQQQRPFLTAPLTALAAAGEAANLGQHSAEDRRRRARAGLPAPERSLGARIRRLTRPRGAHGD